MHKVSNASDSKKQAFDPKVTMAKKLNITQCNPKAQKENKVRIVQLLYCRNRTQYINKTPFGKAVYKAKEGTKGKIQDLIDTRYET